MYRLIAVMLLASVLAAPGSALAQEAAPTEGSPALARGLAALEQDDFEVALQNFQSAFEAGEPDAGFYLGRMAELGIGVRGGFRSGPRVPLMPLAADAGQRRAGHENRIGP